MSEEISCPFCFPRPHEIFHDGALVLGIWDTFPVSEGHALLITKRHVPSWFDASDEERTELVAACEIARSAIEKRYRPDGYNIGVNVGRAAGQTVPHLHMHVIPRYTGDVPDPKGGVRWVIPRKANYLAASDSAGLRKLQPTYGELAVTEAGPLLSTGEDFPLWPLLERDLATANRLDMAVAFVMPTGVERFYPHLEDHLTRGGSLRLVTGDYLDICDPDALQRLLDLQTLHSTDRVALRVFVADGQSFHPKSYILSDSADSGVAYVGSSNLSGSALLHGVEWNFRVIASRDRVGFERVRQAFEFLFRHPKTRKIDIEWLREYRDRRRLAVIRTDAISDAAPEPALQVPEPNAIQRQALKALDETRRQGFKAGLVVLPTGLGKTWLAAFDSNRIEFRRLLFVAHREEILRQALATFRRIRPQATLGLYTGEEKIPDADAVFASIQTLGKRAHLYRFEQNAFDYVIIDEFHHASAATYRRLIWHFEPRFLLGLTATPERTDGGDLLALCQENLVFRSCVLQGIREELLCPFSYYGVPDEIDYSNIPWRNNRFDEETLTSAVATQARAANILAQWRKRGGTRTLAFCVSQRHADFMRDYFATLDVRSASVHAGPGSDQRAGSLERLAAGELQVVFAVDMFNEGVDVPSIDTVMMLRPTESRIVWLQQFGRGLRRHGDKRLRVIDYIGNHRSFLLKARTLLELPSTDDQSLSAALRKLEDGTWVLPPGCDVTYELEALDIMRALLRPAAPDALKGFYEDFRERTGQRPTAVEVFQERYSPRSVQRAHGSWLGFVAAMGGMGAGTQRAFEESRPFLDALEVTAMTKSYKMLALLALLEQNQIPGAGLDINALATEFRRMASRSPVLVVDVGPALNNDGELRSLLEQNPIAAWTRPAATGGVVAFSYENGVFKYIRPVAAANREAFRELVGEIVQWRLAQYMARGGLQNATHFDMKVSHSGERPILFLDRTRAEGAPMGWHAVTIDGERYDGNFVKVAVNVVRRPGSTENALPGILRHWFGATAGQPGTRQFVRCEAGDQGTILRPVAPGEADGDI